MTVSAAPKVTPIKNNMRSERRSTPVAGAEVKPRITVLGCGGAGCNAVNNMIASNLEGVEFVISNTDSQALHQSMTENRVQLGIEATQGLGAGSKPEVGRAAAEETMNELYKYIEGTNMLFITAGMGGGTGTGASPVIAQAARDMGILTIGVVTKPFHFEGAHRMRTAEHGIEELQRYVDTLIVIPNQNLFRVANEHTTFADAFKMADDVLYSGVRSVTDLMIIPGLINLDFADIRSVMTEMGKAMMGTGEAGGESRAIQAAEAAISNPLLDDVSMKGARGVLISVTGGMDMTLFEVDEAANRIRDEVEADANIIFGSTFDEKLNGQMRVSVVATGIDEGNIAAPAMTPVSRVDDLVSRIPEISTEPDADIEISAAQDIEEESKDLEDNESAVENFEQSPQDDTPQRSGLFSRLARPFKSKPTPQVVASPDSCEMRVRKTDPLAEDDSVEEEEVSDIPAFLRKQAK